MRARKSTTAPGSAYVPQLDGLRAVAVLGVVAFHARSSVFPGGYIGVDLFFVLSGYLITGILIREFETNGGVAFGQFYLRRMLRLLPALFIVCSFVILAWWNLEGLPDRSATLLGAVGAITYTASPLAAGGTDLGWMLPTWSLSVEEYFYFLWPWVLTALMLKGPRTLRAGMAALLVLAIAYRWFVAFALHWPIERIAYGPDTRTEQLLVGCMLAIVLPRLRRGVPSRVAWAAALVLAIFVVAPSQWSFQAYYYGGSTIVGLLAALLIAHLATCPNGLASRLLARRPLVWTGRRSYGIYLWNLPIVAVVATLPFMGGGGAEMAVKLLLTFLIPAVSFRYVEQRFLQRKRGAVNSIPAGAPRDGTDSSSGSSSGWGSVVDG